MMVLNLLDEKICWLTLVITLTIGQTMAQDNNPVCPPPLPICRTYETASCEWALNMIPVYVCRTDLASILGIGAGQGCQTRPQNVIYQPPITYNQQPAITYTQQPAMAYNQQTVMPSFVPPQSLTMYKTFTSRQPTQYRQAIPPQFVGRDIDQSAQGSPQNGQADSGSGSQPGMFAGRQIGQGAARDASSPSGQPQGQQVGGHGPKSSGTSAYQGASQPSAVPPQPSYSGSQAMNNEEAE